MLLNYFPLLSSIVCFWLFISQMLASFINTLLIIDANIVFLHCLFPTLNLLMLALYDLSASKHWCWIDFLINYKPALDAAAKLQTKCLSLLKYEKMSVKESQSLLGLLVMLAKLQILIVINVLPNMLPANDLPMSYWFLHDS